MSRNLWLIPVLGGRIIAAEVYRMDQSGGPETASEVASATAQEVKQTVREQRESLERYIRQNPLQTIAVAAGIGFVFALMRNGRVRS
jgi:ElaB/YqjD/DUF883 family membrane-anchored ribosome-binding protein